MGQSDFTRPDGAPDLRVGKEKTVPHGIVAAKGCPANEWRRNEFALPEDLHLAGSMIIWRNMEPDDYGFVVLINPLGETNPTAQVLVGQTVINVALAKAPYYDPDNANAKTVEIWDGAGENANLKEVRPIQSVNTGTGDVTLAEPLAYQVEVTDVLRVCLDGFMLDLGGDHNNAGIQLLGDGSWYVHEQHEVTELIPTGMALGARFKAGAVVASRDLVTNYIFRRPDE